jgi:D-hydroxyproline dehydrogenase subunit beta
VTNSGRSDLVVVGAGIVGLAHAAAAAARGASVTVVERDARPVGASVRNFGHICVTAQSGRALNYAGVARQRWIELGAEAGFWVGQTGAVVVARATDEMAVLEELASERGDGVEVLDAAGVLARLPLIGDGVVGGAYLRADLRVEPSEAVHALAGWLARQPQVTVHWATNVAFIEQGVVHTSRGPVESDRVVVCVNHDVDRIYPELAAEAGLQRCLLHMLRVRTVRKVVYEPAVLTGTSLLRYPAFTGCPSAKPLRERFERDHCDLLNAGVNLMFTQRPDGTITLGDTHHYGTTLDPFRAEELDDLLLSEGRRLVGSELAVCQRWQGVYASAPGEYLVAVPSQGVRVVSVTSGIGMTTAFGLAPEVLDGLFD